MNQPEHILRTLDRHLQASTRLILYGRAALALGYPQPRPEFLVTMDVDAILPEIEIESIDSDGQFWEALEQTNESLKSTGLYLTHLFTDQQVILRPFWLDVIVPLQLQGLRYLNLFRPATEDLILTKMMRIDPQDRSDLQFLISQLTSNIHLTTLFQTARIPNIPEIRDAFEQNRLWIETGE